MPVLTAAIAGSAALGGVWLSGRQERESQRRERESQRRQRQDRRDEEVGAALGPVLTILRDASPDSYALWASDEMYEARTDLVKRWLDAREQLSAWEVTYPDECVRVELGLIAQDVEDLIFLLRRILEEVLGNGEYREFIAAAHEKKGDAEQRVRSLLPFPSSE